MPKTRETQEIEAEIRRINQERAMADKRLERFSQAVAKIKKKNKNLLESMGMTSLKELEEIIMGQGVHPEELKMFKDALTEIGADMPEFGNRLAQSKNAGHSHDTARETVKKKKRLRIKL